MIDIGEAWVLRVVLIGTALVALLFVPVGSWYLDGPFVMGWLATAACAWGLSALLSRDPARGIPITLATGLGVVFVLTPFTGGYSGPMTSAWCTLVLLTAIAMGTKWAILVSIVGSVYLGGLFVLESQGIGPFAASPPHLDLASIAVMMFVVAGLAGRALGRERKLLAESKTLERAARTALGERDAELSRRAVSEAKLRDAMAATAGANAAKSEFLANMSHELRTPLNAIIGYAEILLEEAENEGTADDLGRIRGAGRHLLTLINDVLDLSKIEAGRMELVRSEVELDVLVHELVATLGPAIAVNGNRFVLDCPDPLGTVYSDRTRIQQVLLNLLSNAAKFTSDGEVRLEGRRVGEPGRERIVFRVHDTGIGISSAQMVRLFRPFTQADGSTSRRFGGTGLGLVLARHFAEMMEGEVRVASEPGVGSTFTLDLPVRTVASDLAKRQSQRILEAGRTERPVVLCVDDSPTDLLVLERMLDAGGLHPVPCPDPRAVVELARRLRPAAITLDLHMPRIDGASVLEALKSDPALEDIPVLVLSVDGAASALVARGASGWLPKPVDRDVLLDLVRTSLPHEAASVLVVDDDAQIRDVLRRTLTGEGFAVREAAGGAEALQEVAREAPGLVLLDLMMPEVDGFEVAEHLGTSHPDVPIVVLTAADLGDDDRSRLAACRSVLDKAGDLDGLVDRIREAAAA